MKIYQEKNEQIFCYDLEKGLMIFSGDTTEVGGFIDFMNECFENLKNYKADCMQVTFNNIELKEDAMRMLVIHLLSVLARCCKKVVVEWYYNNSKVLEIGQEFSELFDEVEFRFYELAKSS